MTRQPDLFEPDGDDGALAGVSGVWSERERACAWCLWRVEGIGWARMRQIEAACGGQLEALWADEALAARALRAARLRGKALRGLRDALAADPVAELGAELARLGPHDQLIHARDPSYPPALRELDDPPVFVYVRGPLDALMLPHRLALVGSRRVPAAQQRDARELAGQLAGLGAILISGGARGMDRAAHEGALDVGGLTAAMLAGGLLHPAPRRHAPLFARIVEAGGALVTEYPAAVEPRRYHFPRRNRLIAALSQGVVILKASRRGGTRLTAEAARQLGRPMVALPYEASDRGARGSHELLRRGHAVMACCPEEVFAHCLGVPLEPGTPAGDDEPPRAASAEQGGGASAPREELEEVSATARALLEALRRLDGAEPGPVALEALRAAAGLGPAEVMAAITELELVGRARKTPGAARWELAGR